MSTNGKKAAAKQAALIIEQGMRIGLGTGTTASYFITELGQRCRLEGLRISAAATSFASQKLAEQQGIPLIDINTVSSLDLAIDGADEIDPKKRMIKGGGGALLREKIIAAMSREMIVIVDSSKEVDFLGKFPLAVEITPFGYIATLHHLELQNYHATLRKNIHGEIYLSDNENYLVDIQLSYPCLEPEKEEERLKKIPGVVETGFFLNLAGRVIRGHPDGQVKSY